MTVKSRTFYIAVCDVCGAEPDSEAPWRDSHDEACEVAGYSDWWATEYEVLCGATSPEHLAKAADIATGLIKSDTNGEALDDFRQWCETVGYQLEAFTTSSDDQP